MEKNYKNFRIIVADSYEDMGVLAADIITKQIISKPASVLGLATGSTPISTYKSLINLHKGGVVSFGDVSTFNLDEYHPIRKINNQSYAYYMNEKLFSHIDLLLQNAFIPNGETKDLSKECLEYEQRIADLGGIDLQILGLGNNGHIGFNEPADVFPNATHHVALDESTIKANARFFVDEADVPKHAITMGIGTIMQSKHILVLISGEAKADIAEKVIFGDITPKIPGSVLQLHQAVTVILDMEAGEKVLRLI